MKLFLKIIGSTLLIALCLAILAFTGFFLWSAIPRERPEPQVLSTDALFQEEAEAAPPAEIVAPTEDTVETPPEEPEEPEEEPEEPEEEPTEEPEEEEPVEEAPQPAYGDLVQELFIPMELNGVRVNCLDLAAVPRQVSMIYLPERVNFDYDSKSTETFECQLVRYMDYATAKEKGYVLERAPQMTESDWALSEVDQLVFDQGKLQYKDISVLASQLPETLDGHRCHAVCQW